MFWLPNSLIWSVAFIGLSPLLPCILQHTLLLSFSLYTTIHFEFEFYVYSNLIMAGTQLRIGRYTNILLATLAFTTVVPVNAADTTCGIVGYDSSLAYYSTTDPTIANFPNCTAACDADPSCLSYCVRYGDPPQCNLYTLPLIENVRPSGTLDFIFYDKGCSEELLPVDHTPGLSFPAEVCGVAGYDIDCRAYYDDTTGETANWDDCSALCNADCNCHSFAYGDSQCLLYIVPAINNTNPVPTSPYLFFDKSCPAPPVVSSSTSSITTTTSSYTSSSISTTSTTSSTLPITSCPPGLTLCEGACANTTSDSNNCGSCGNAVSIN